MKTIKKALIISILMGITFSGCTATVRAKPRNSKITIIEQNNNGKKIGHKKNNKQNENVTIIVR